MKTMSLGKVIVDNQVSGDNVAPISQAYDIGAYSVLSEMAVLKFRELENANKIQFAPVCKEISDQLNESYNELMTLLTGDNALRAKILAYDDKACYWASMTGESNFIQGYIEGYLFAKRVAGDSVGI